LNRRTQKMQNTFKAKIYKIGINAVVDVPKRVTSNLVATAGRIKIKGIINGFDFKTTLMPVKDGLHLLYVNMIMLKGGATTLGKTASFSLEQDTRKKLEKKHSMHKALLKQLIAKKMVENFHALTPARKKDILTYLHQVKATDTLNRNINNVILQLERKQKNVRIPLPLKRS
jgi:hypothetical protein